ncbi:MAG: glycosyl transferase family 2 [Desulfobacteraceae bacterium 4572_35.1]|nr:MAG: glycosyl transferase family 2 [Desulfobacteraceae bacterium 4572_35.1]
MHHDNVSLDQLLVVVPLYNHGGTVRDVVQRCLQQHAHVLVVDDGSSDGGAQTLTDLKVTVLRHEVNRGKGEAILTAAAQARQRGFSHIVTIDADAQHLPEDLPLFFKAVMREPLAVYVGMRDFSADNIPASSRFGRHFSNFWLRVETGCKLGDAQSGFRAYPLAVLEHLHFTDSRYSFEVEVLVKACWAGVPLHDLPIQVYYAPGSERISHFNKVRDNINLSWLNMRLCMRSIAPWPHKRLIRADQPPFSWRQPLQSLRNLLAQDISPSKLGLAMALGLLLGTLPLIACHTVVTLFAAGFIGVNRYLAVAAGNLCMPPLVPALCIELGYFFRHGKWLTDISFETLGLQCIDRVYEWFLGSLLLGPLFAIVGGLIVYVISRWLQQRAWQTVSDRDTSCP